MADDELRRVSPGIAAKVGRTGNLGGTAGIVLVPLWDGGLFLFSLFSASQITKPEVCIINGARGGVVNEGDLVEAVEQGIVAGAAIIYLRDVLML